MAAINPSLKRELDELVSQQIQAFKHVATMDDRDILAYHLRHLRIMALYREMEGIARTMQRTQGWLGSYRAFGRILASAAQEVCMLHSDLFPAFGCDGELIEIPERSTQLITVKRCEKCETELSWVADDEHWVNVVYPGMRESMDRPT